MYLYVNSEIFTQQGESWRCGHPYGKANPADRSWDPQTNSVMGPKQEEEENCETWKSLKKKSPSYKKLKVWDMAEWETWEGFFKKYKHWLG